MGALTDVDKIWYPGTTDLDQPNVYMATHSQSIEDGIGARLRQQELAVGMKANLPPSSFPLTKVSAILPYVVNGSFGSFKQGLEVNGGVVTVETRGMYLVTASLGLGVYSGLSLAIELFKNGTMIAINETPASTNFWTTAASTCVVSCVPGDTLHAKGRAVGSWSSAMNSPDGAANYLSIAMVQAVPDPA